MIGRLEIPRLGIRAMIADGTDSRTLGRAIGHLRHTPMPGERGNVALAAHRDTYFKPLRDVRPRDVIRITTPDGVFAYRVDWTKVVEPKRIDLLRPAKRSELTLITCYPFDAIGPAPRRFVVRAVEIGRESPARS
jgi:sortase A